MTKYLLRYTTSQGVQFVQEFTSEKDRDIAFNAIGSTKRIYGRGNLVLISDSIVCVEAIEESVDNTIEDFVGDKD